MFVRSENQALFVYQHHRIINLNSLSRSLKEIGFKYFVFTTNINLGWVYKINFDFRFIDDYHNQLLLKLKILINKNKYNKASLVYPIKANFIITVQ